jgi:hypothetical protein
MNEENEIYIENEVLLSKKKSRLFARKRIELGIITLSEISQIQKDKYYMVLLIYGVQNKSNNMTCLYKGINILIPLF